MAGWARKRCPLDGAPLEYHCQTSTCPWWRCPRETCRALLNLRRGLGYQNLPDGQGGLVVRPFTFPAQAPPDPAAPPVPPGG